MNHLRIVHRFLDDSISSFQEIAFADLKEGDRFRMFEDTGRPVLYNNEEGKDVYVAISDPYPAFYQADVWNEEGMRLTIDVDLFDKTLIKGDLYDTV